MQFSWKPVGIAILLWVGLMFMLLFHLLCLEHELLRFLPFVYMLVISFSLTRLEKRSIIDRFGFQRNNVLGLVVMICVGLTVFYLFYEFSVDDFSMIVAAPLVEEIFFRGCMLGILLEGNYKESELIPIEYLWIILTSSLFALGHIFRYYTTSPESMWSSMFSILIGSLIHGLFYVWFRTILFSVSVHMLYNAYPPIRNHIVDLSLVVFIGSLVHAILKRSRKRDM